MYRLRLHRHLLLLCAALLAAAAIALPVLANEAPLPHVAVIYPQVREPYRAVFRSISEGIAAASARSAVHELAPGEDLSAIERQLAGQPLDAVILLGKRGLDLSAQLGNNTRRIVGAVFAQPDEIAPGVSVISLAPAPRMLFARLRELAPAVRRIHVIHGVDVNDWLIERAKQDAAAAGYELVAQRMDSIRDGANAYRELLPRMRSPQDALWLLQASPFLERGLGAADGVARRLGSQSRDLLEQPVARAQGSVVRIVPERQRTRSSPGPRGRSGTDARCTAAATGATAHGNQYPYGRPSGSGTRRA